MAALTQKWREFAACQGENTDMFFPVETHETEIREARQVCSRCPVTRYCLQYAVVHNCTGIWGGTTDAERRAQRRTALAADAKRETERTEGAA